MIFEDLLQSVEEAGYILRKVKAPSRRWIWESVVDYPKPALPTIWRKEGEKWILREEVRAQINEILDTYPKFDLLQIGDQIHITGSIGTNQYTPDADIDVHIVVDPGMFGDPEGIQREVFKFFIDADNRIEGHPVEVYLQYNPAQEMLSDAVYDYRSEEWVVGPKLVDPSYDPQEDFSGVLADVRAQASRADLGIGELRRDIVDYETIQQAIEGLPSREQKILLTKLQGKLVEIQQDIDTLLDLKKGWGLMRRKSSIPKDETEALQSVDLAKSWRDANFTFKMLNRYKYMRVIALLDGIVTGKTLDDETLDTIKSVTGIV